MRGPGPHSLLPVRYGRREAEALPRTPPTGLLAVWDDPCIKELTNIYTQGWAWEAEAGGWPRLQGHLDYRVIPVSKKKKI